MSEISVIVPVYRVEKYIRRCVDSILSQTFTDFELILVDDGSPDRCGEICDEYAKNDSRITVNHQTNGGLSAARNAGIDHVLESSTSKWITFIDSDDWVHPEYLERLYDAVKSNGMEIAVCELYRTEQDNMAYSSCSNQVQFLKPECMYVEKSVVFAVACAKLYRKELFQNIRYPLGKIHEDEFVTYRVMFGQEKVAYLTDQLYYYFVNPMGITSQKWDFRKLAIPEALTEQLDFFRQNGFKRAEQDCAVRLFYRSGEAVLNLKQNFPNQTELIKKEIKILRSVIRRYTDILPLEEPLRNVYYRAAYPERVYYAKKKKHLLIFIRRFFNA